MKVLAIMKKELQTFFYSPIAYIVFSSFLLIVGYLFWVVLVTSKAASIEPLLYNASFVLLLVSPVLTMRLISEERKSKTLELLLTSPISPLNKKAGFEPGRDIFIAMDPAANEFYADGIYDLQVEGKKKSN